MQSVLKISNWNVSLGFSVEAKQTSKPWIRQVHGVGIRTVTGPADHETLPLVEADGVMTSLPGTRIHVSTADCLPVFLVGMDRSTQRPLIAAIHSGWRGTMQGIVSKAIEHWSATLDDTYAILGPSIGLCHFEVKQDFIDTFCGTDPRATDFLQQRDGKHFFDLSGFVRNIQLRPLKPAHILSDFNVCTVCHTPALPSFRRDKVTDPHIKAWIQSDLQKDH